MPNGTTNLQIGDVFELKNGMRFYAKVAEKYIYANRSGSNKKATSNFVLSDAKHLKKFAGKYIVVDTKFDGVGIGMGPHDVFPNGHHVFARKMYEMGDDVAYNKNGLKIDFYQSGSFNAMNERVKVICKMERQINFV